MSHTMSDEVRAAVEDARGNHVDSSGFEIVRRKSFSQVRYIVRAVCMNPNMSVGDLLHELDGEVPD